MNAQKLIDKQLKEYREYVSKNLIVIQDCETQIHELKMRNVDLMADIEGLENSAMLLRVQS